MMKMRMMRMIKINRHWKGTTIPTRVVVHSLRKHFFCGGVVIFF